MAKKETEKIVLDAPQEQESQEKTTKLVFNRGYNKVELIHNGTLYVFPVNKYTEVPEEMNIPQNLGLEVR